MTMNQQHWSKYCSHKQKRILLDPFLWYWLWYFYRWCHRSLGGEGFEKFVHHCCFLFSPSRESKPWPFSHILLPIVFCAFMNAPSLSLSFLLITIYESMPALSWPKTGHPRLGAAALEVLYPLKLLSLTSKFQIAFLAQPSLESAWFFKAKHCQTLCGASLVAAWNLHYSCVR